MKEKETGQDGPAWECVRCRKKLVVGKVTVSYMGNRFTIDLPHCPQCGMVMISEEMASGKMTEVERMLEDK